MDRQTGIRIRQLKATLDSALQKAETMWDSSAVQRDFFLQCRQVGAELMTLADQHLAPHPGP
ncbi:MAG: hypothetical protein AB1445_04325 [Bacillota bacterium]